MNVVKCYDVQNSIKYNINTLKLTLKEYKSKKLHISKLTI